MYLIIVYFVVITEHEYALYPKHRLPPNMVVKTHSSLEGALSGKMCSNKHHCFSLEISDQFV